MDRNIRFRYNLFAVNDVIDPEGWILSMMTIGVAFSVMKVRSKPVLISMRFSPFWSWGK